MHNRDVFFKRVVTIVLLLFVQTLDITTHLFVPFFFANCMDLRERIIKFVYWFNFFASCEGQPLSYHSLSSIKLRCFLSDNDTTPSKMAFFFFCRKTLLELSLTWGLDRIVIGFCWGYHFAQILNLLKLRKCYIWWDGEDLTWENQANLHLDKIFCTLQAPVSILGCFSGFTLFYKTIKLETLWWR